MRILAFLPKTAIRATGEGHYGGVAVRWNHELLVSSYFVIQYTRSIISEPGPVFLIFKEKGRHRECTVSNVKYEAVKETLGHIS